MASSAQLSKLPLAMPAAEGKAGGCGGSQRFKTTPTQCLQSHGKRWARAMAARATVALCVGAFAGAALFTGTAMAAAVYNNVTIHQDAAGERVIDVRWAITPANVKTLRIPWAYRGDIVASICHPFSADVVDPDCAQPFAATASLKASFPPFGAPVAAGASNFRIELLSSVFAKQPSEQKVFAAIAKDSIDTFVGDDDAIDTYPTDYNLNVVVPNWQKNRRLNKPDNDAYYEGADLNDSQLIAICPDDNLSKLNRDYKRSGADAICEMYFPLPALRAQVHVTGFVRTQLTRIRLLKEAVSSFILSIVED